MLRPFYLERLLLIMVVLGEAGAATAHPRAAGIGGVGFCKILEKMVGLQVA